MSFLHARFDYRGIGRVTPTARHVGLPEPSDGLAAALASFGRIVHGTPMPVGASSFDALLTAAREEHPDEITLDRVVRRSLLSMLEERRTRQPFGASDTRGLIGPGHTRAHREDAWGKSLRSDAGRWNEREP
jgi:hypothetical protein